MARIADCDQLAFAELYDRHSSSALGLAYRVLGDRGAAEEVVQDAFVAAWRRARSFSPDRGEPRAWLLSIVRHRAIDRTRGRPTAATRAEVPLELAASSTDESDVWRDVQQGLERREIVAALAEIPAAQREAVELAFFGGLSHIEVAARMSEPLGTIKGRMRLGLLKLRTVLQGHGNESPGE